MLHEISHMIIQYIYLKTGSFQEWWIWSESECFLWNCEVYPGHVRPNILQQVISWSHIINGDRVNVFDQVPLYKPL